MPTEPTTTPPPPETAYDQPPLYYCASCGGHYPIRHFC